jgi:1-acyl-sn-glycerol-3-phosphate acyltransferase
MVRSAQGWAAEIGFSFDADSLAHRDASLIGRLLPTLLRFNRAYLRLTVDGREHIPRGPALFVANHNGGIFGPDLLCTLGLLWDARGPETPLYALAHDFAMRQFLPLGRQLARVGAVRASRDNARRALGTGAGVLVYPGGDLEAYRHFRRRNEIVILPRKGFVELAREAGVPIVPIVAHGAHQSAVILTEGERIARLLGLRRWGRLERFPVALALPWGIAPGPWLPYLPLPGRVRLRVLAPITPRSDTPATEEARRVQAGMQAALDEMAGDRRPR